MSITINVRLSCGSYHARAMGLGVTASSAEGAPAAARAVCRFGVEPDTDFDRFQWSPAQLWEVVSDVLLGQRVIL